MDIIAEPVFDATCELGEGPLWSENEQALYWVDVLGRKIWKSHKGAEEPQAFSTRNMPSSFAPRASGGLIVAMRNGLKFLDLEAGTEEAVETGIDFSRERFNDGKCDRRGRFVVGTMDKLAEEPIGALYSIGADHQCTKLADDILLSNGLAWTADNQILYHNDSRRGRVYAYDYDIETGAVANRRLHIDFSGKGGNPDGCAIDSDDCLWIAEVGLGRIARYDPDGRYMSCVRVPTSRVTSATFGGPDLKTLFITTMQFNLTPEQRAAEPLAGRSFAAFPDARGLPETPYAG